MESLSGISRVADLLKEGLLSDLEWRCAVIDDPKAADPDFEDGGWTGQRSLMGRRWDVAWFRTDFIVPKLAGDKPLLIRPLMGGTCRVFAEGAQVGDCEAGGTVEIPPVVAGRRRVIAIRSTGGWLSHENPSPASIDWEGRSETLALYEELLFAMGIRNAVEDPSPIESCLEEFLSAVDVRSPDRSPQAFLSSLQNARGALGPVGEVLRRYEIHVVPHSHVDLAWGWTYEETKRIMRTIFDRATELMELDPEYTFAQDQPPAYVHLEGTVLMEKMARRISEGRLDVAGAFYSQPEGNLPCGESFIRQIMLCKRYFAGRFGVEPVTGWNLDSFSGHCWSLPQILSKSGVRYYTFANWANLIPDVEFWWEGPDGSKILAYHLPCHYDSAQMMGHDKILKNLFGYISRSKARKFMFLDGDDLTPPVRESLEGVSWFRGLRIAPDVSFSTPRRFFEELEAPGLEGVPTYRGELLQYLDPQGDNNVGSYTTHAEVKRRNRQCEGLLLSAEKLGSIASLLGMEFPRDRIGRAWHNVLLNQMHDILPGTAIREAYVEAHQGYDEAEKIAREAIARAAGTIASRVDTSGKGIPIVVFNTLGWERTGLASFTVTLAHSYQAWPRITSDTGEDVECQVIRDSLGTYDKTNRNLEIIFPARDVPALGYRTYHLGLDGAPPQASPIEEKDGTLRLGNEFLEAGVSTRTGLLESLARDGDEFLPGEAQGLLFQRYDDDGDPWHIRIKGDPVELEEADVSVLEEGPVRWSVLVGRRHGGTEISETISVSRSIPLVSCQVTIDCRELNCLYKVGVPFAGGSPKAVFEIPFAAIERKGEMDRPAQNWVDISDGSRGLALINNGRYGYDLTGSNLLRLSLLRNPRGHRSREGTDTGIHTTSLAIYPHRGEWRSGVVRQGMEFNNPLICHVDSRHTGDLPPRLSFMSIGDPNVVLSSLKLHEDSKDLILRVYECHGREASLEIDSRIQWDEIREIDMVERDQAGITTKGSMPVSPFEIRTFRLTNPRIRAGPG